MKDKFEVIGKLKIKENFNRSGGYDYLSNLERFEDILNDIDRHMEIFRNVKFPIKLLCENEMECVKSALLSGNG
jgi:hypothetical protein